MSTWSAMKGVGKYGLSTRGPSFDQILVQNRQNPALADVLAIIVGTPVADLMVSHDRFEHQILNKKSSSDASTY